MTSYDTSMNGYDEAYDVARMRGFKVEQYGVPELLDVPRNTDLLPGRMVIYGNLDKYVIYKYGKFVYLNEEPINIKMSKFQYIDLLRDALN
jgi:hypothetical protein